MKNWTGWRDIASGGVLVGARYQVVSLGAGGEIRLWDPPHPSQFQPAPVAWQLYWSGHIYFCNGVSRADKGVPVFDAATLGLLLAKQLRCRLDWWLVVTVPASNDVITLALVFYSQFLFDEMSNFGFTPHQKY